jgi:hypothetical protein
LGWPRVEKPCWVVLGDRWRWMEMR